MFDLLGWLRVILSGRGGKDPFDKFRFCSMTGFLCTTSDVAEICLVEVSWVCDARLGIGRCESMVFLASHGNV